MKTSVLYTSLALAGIVSAQEACVEGKRVTISPGYTVEYKCDKYRLGQLHKNVLSHEDCATKCQVGNLDVCTYHATKKMCHVGDPNGTEGTRTGATYMVRVPEEPENPFPEEEDPFPETCDEQRDNLRGELDQCRADVERLKKPPTCGSNMVGKEPYLFQKAANFAACKNLCNAQSNCLSYTATTVSVATFCSLFDKEAADISPGSRTHDPVYRQFDKRCG